MRFTLVCGVAMLLLAGCGNDEPMQPAGNTAAGQPRAPYSDPAPAANVPADQALSKLEADYTVAKANYEKARGKDVEGKFVEATVKLGTATMTSPELSAREKYRKALQLYREALAIDPNNAEAKSNTKMIEDIYKQMGRPVPQ